ncbi:hypothetical protein HMPREF3220_04035 [Citrobacter koseri]|nr:hypothetical protein HMPREF3220_04035 [Citrobacter koseri]KXA05255.1 hypothetical protein HMPREF3207_00917 [Citrobacter koseri]
MRNLSLLMSFWWVKIIMNVRHFAQQCASWQLIRMIGRTV